MSREQRPKLRRITLEEAVRLFGESPPEHVLYLSDPWPWTTGTLVAIAERRPIWAAAAIPLSQLAGITERSADLSVREINRRTDPGPRPPRRR